jgi:hypothetical protein
MSESMIWTFFYGSYINFDVLREVELVPRQWEIARLSGFDIVIRPRANLVRNEGSCVYGIVATATHRELIRLYAHAKDVLGETYLPDAVLVETGVDRGWGTWRPALCYICPDMSPRPADPPYVDRIAGPARRYGFPDWYVARIERFRDRAGPTT